MLNSDELVESNQSLSSCDFSSSQMHVHPFLFAEGKQMLCEEMKRSILPLDEDLVSRLRGSLDQNPSSSGDASMPLHALVIFNQTMYDIFNKKQAANQSRPTRVCMLLLELAKAMRDDWLSISKSRQDSPFHSSNNSVTSTMSSESVIVPKPTRLLDIMYKSPEELAMLLENNVFDRCQTSDIYSFAVIAWQVATDYDELMLEGGDEYYEVVFYEDFEKDQVESFVRKVIMGSRPRLDILDDKVWPETFKKCLSKCWNKDILCRPSFADVVEVLTDLLSIFKKDEADGRRVLLLSRRASKKITNYRQRRSALQRDSEWF